ncbi:DUF1330 domain-containing protein [Streptomyces sp. RGM 3693]|uniref:DUF1330 domain-containing protein n=1 Tax=Streptomyces sp. RGM 3693 TaxID=3413284 RepID=UPI003D2D2119
MAITSKGIARAGAHLYVRFVVPHGDADEPVEEPNVSAYGFAHLRSRRHHSDVLEYLERIQATLDPFHGRFVIHGPPAEVLEGVWLGSMVLIEFPDVAGPCLV